MGVCEGCRKALGKPGRPRAVTIGRKRRYCGARCRLRVWRAKKDVVVPDRSQIALQPHQPTEAGVCAICQEEGLVRTEEGVCVACAQIVEAAGGESMRLRLVAAHLDCTQRSWQ